MHQPNPLDFFDANMPTVARTVVCAYRGGICITCQSRGPGRPATVELHRCHFLTIALFSRTGLVLHNHTWHILTVPVNPMHCSVYCTSESCLHSCLRNLYILFHSLKKFRLTINHTNSHALLGNSCNQHALGG